MTVSALTLIAIAGLPAGAGATVMNFGSDLTAPATLDTAHDLLPAGHNGSDTFLWNTQLANGSDPHAPFNGQVTDIRVKGCLNLSAGPTPLTGIEFQDLSVNADGSFSTINGRTAAVDATGTHFQMPACTSGGSGPNTVTDFKPVNLCTSAGHVIDFVYNGDFNQTLYPNGVPYQVLGRVANSSFDSYVLYPNGQESVFKPGDVGQGGGFYANPSEELMLQATVGNGADGTGLCPGGGGQAPPPTPTPTPAPVGGGAPPVKVVLHSQRDGVNRKGVVKVAIYCADKAGCSGTAALSNSGRTLASHAFKIPGKKTSKVALKLKRPAIAKIRKHKRKLAAKLTVTVSGQTVSQAVTLKI